MKAKIEEYELLPADRKFMASMTLDIVLESLPILCKDPFKLWETIEL
jgi:hypothetical protein